MKTLTKSFALLAALSQLASAQGLELSVRKIGDMFHKAVNAPILGQDGAYSIPLADGSALWTFGDTLVGETLPGGEDKLWGMPSSSFAILEATDPFSLEGELRYVRDPQDWPAPLIRYEPGELESIRRFWPQHGVQAGGKVYVFYTFIQASKSGMWSFAIIGQGLVMAEKPEGPYRRVLYKGNPIIWSDLEPSFGGAVLQGKDGWIYLYGRGIVAQDKYSMFLARVKGADLGDREAYQYFSRKGSSEAWVKNSWEASALFEDAASELSVSFNERLGKYLMLYSNLLTQSVEMRTAAQPWGDWSQARTAMTCENLGKDEFCYAAKEHPELSRNRGQDVYFTLVRNKIYVPELYELHFK
ncbi:MAG: DUF4185 domain-containing protein [Elusimicrobia bacterium]|nr:DUF4185 domain-containing protein [Elusimicrobiota bacterium]